MNYYTFSQLFLLELFAKTILVATEFLNELDLLLSQNLIWLLKIS